ncbi:bifunctional 4-hydroxy-2-oxoglutarate aldolase/2-dehydro-3-deoxy-phosphogluconate aldolase [Pontibacter sp. JH31]|uniref:Bifunctional 4-hydroxy-2-oxoglutarate aldolase/2-dehydro-3-deoxy-phosphogluconate aldolase n=1 Tax=Pontibacter aquaedesilientis TaxID=2766980 RepID=A0ABR7XBW0_9BACT|nr:bifunctional 4-hydroxy-2-oxoglutarate aldolase/2-dehydro-3-deoxy-phosphogluconate aldolase [Pontibacter aquaedesilientis]MBD1395793.1 bifunctional 4-hydroxy-2-oxoglutarate aldolase/2-dehydro-3-deoxy-phosphogluconate aldolase [Pontibacter aquaedesilientis]
MSRRTRIEVALAMEATGLIPLFYEADFEVAKQILCSCYRGGARVVEFTNRGEFAHEVFAALVKFARVELPELILGIGSVTDAGTAALYMQLGAEFIVTPVLREDIAKVCNRRKVLWLPGCQTLTEIAAAEELGAEIVKLFPGESISPGFVSAIKGPCPWTKIMPTGGVSLEEENLAPWFKAGVSCVGAGSKLMADKSNYGAIEQTTKAALDAIKRIRNGVA